MTHMHIRHPKQHVSKQSCSNIQLNSKDELKKNLCGSLLGPLYGHKIKMKDDCFSDTDGVTQQGVLLDHNDSQRYESRFATVRVESSPAIMLQGMEGTVFGMWVSHGEGKFHRRCFSWRG